jgi:hypothetical protein
VKRLYEHASAHAQRPQGRVSDENENVKKVEKFFVENKKAHIREVAQKIKLSYGTEWNILSGILKWKYYKPHRVHAPAPANKQPRKLALSG